MALLEAPRPVRHLRAGRPEGRPRVPDPERREAPEAVHEPRRDLPEPQAPVDPEARPQVVRRQAIVGPGRHRLPERRDPRSLHRQAGRHPMAAESDQVRRAGVERAQDVERRNAAARAVRLVAVRAEDDRRTMVRVDQFRRDDADDAAVPALPRHDQHGPRADVRVVLDQALRLGDDGAFLGLPALVLRVQLRRQPPRLVEHAVVGRQQQPQGDVRRAHAPGRVHARRDDERHVIAVNRLAAEARRLDERPQAGLVRAARQQVEAEARDDAVLAEHGHDVGQRADRGQLEEPRQPLVLARAAAERLHQLQRHADTRQVLVGIRRSPRASGLMTASACGSVGVGLVMVGHDQIDAQFARPDGSLHPADPAVHRDDEAQRRRRRAARWPAC